MILLAALLTAAAPAPEASEVGLARAVLAFEQRCAACHGESAAKGGLRLHTAAGWMDAVEPGSAEDSELLYRLTLPADDGEAMPPEGPRLGAEAVDAIRSWVLAGADVGELEGAMAEAARAGAEAERLDALREQIAGTIGARIAPLESADGVSVSWSHMPNLPTAEALEALAPLADSIVELRLAGVSFDPPILRSLPELPRLISARLERSPVDDDGVLALLAKAPALTELNVHSTRISTRSADLRARYPRLRRLVLHGTPAAPPTPEPFAAVPSRQPRRYLVGSAASGRVALLRETVVGRPELLWQRRISGLHGLWWRAEIGGGHGRVLIQESPTGFIEVDTSLDRVVRSGEGPPDAAHPGSRTHVVDRPSGRAVLVVIERTR